MNHQSGFGLSEVLISLFLASLIMTTLGQLYLINKRQYNVSQGILETGFDVQWISELLSDSIRRAGFTPCMGINNLQTVDTRKKTTAIAAIKIDSSSRQLFQINRMDEVFAEIISIQTATELIVTSAAPFDEQHPILIADCEHAEVHQILKVDKLLKGYLVTLMRPLVFSYPSSTYMGKWLEEQWFIKKNTKGIKSLYYKLFQTEELTPLIHSLIINNRSVHGKQLVDVSMGLDDDSTHQFVVAVRGS